MRDKATDKPMVWDNGSSSAKVFDDPTVTDYALLGQYTVQGVECRPSWELLRERFKEYTPESAEPICGVPAATLRRIATEFAEAASIGSTIIIDGKELPPAGGDLQHPLGRHPQERDPDAVCIGPAQSCGRRRLCSRRPDLGFEECFGYPGANRPGMMAAACKDGLLRTGGKWLFPEGGPWPLQEPKCPTHDLAEVFPCAWKCPWSTRWTGKRF